MFRTATVGFACLCVYVCIIFNTLFIVLQCIVGYTLSGEEAISHAELMLPMIRRRTSDDKVIVRKAAIQVYKDLT